MQLNIVMDKELQNIYESLFVEYQSGFNPPQRIPKQEVPMDAGTKLSYNKQIIGIAPPMVTSHVYGEQEEDMDDILKIIQDVESEYAGDSPINDAVRFALGKVKSKIK